MIYSDDLLDNIRNRKLSRKDLKEVVWLSCVNLEHLARRCSMSTTAVSRFINGNLDLRFDHEIYDRIADHIEGCNEVTGTKLVTILTSGPELKVAMDELRLTEKLVLENTGIYDLFTFISGIGRMRLKNKINLITFINGFGDRHYIKPEYHLPPYKTLENSASL